MDWIKIERVNQKKFIGRPKVYYYPPVTHEKHPSNNRPEAYALERWLNRKPTHFALLDPPTEE